MIRFVLVFPLLFFIGWGVNLHGSVTKIEDQVKEGIFFSTLPLINQSLSNISVFNKKIDRVLDELYLNTGEVFWKSIPDSLVQRSDAPSLHYLMAIRFYDQSQWVKVIKELENFPSDHPLYPGATYLRGTAFIMMKEYSKATLNYKSCYSSAQSAKGSRDGVWDRKYQFIEDSCNIAVGRTLYAAKKFEESHRHYRMIDKRSFKWPNVLFEDSWNSYRLKNYNQTLGRLLTFEAPILSNYFFPESYYLMSLSYTELCLWGDVQESVKRFEEHYLDEGRRLVALLKEKADGRQRYFSKLIISGDDEELSFKLLKNMLGQLKLRPSVMEAKVHLQQIANEQRDLQRKGRSRDIEGQLSYLGEVYALQLLALEHSLQKSLTSFANEVVSMSERLAQIHLEMLARKKSELYQGEQNKLSGDSGKKRTRGDLGLIVSESDDSFWSFSGEFWADELGDVVLALISRCSAKEEGRK